jgi:hypothetical protein
MTMLANRIPHAFNLLGPADSLAGEPNVDRRRQLVQVECASRRAVRHRYQVVGIDRGIDAWKCTGFAETPTERVDACPEATRVGTETPICIVPWSHRTEKGQGGSAHRQCSPGEW